MPKERPNFVLIMTDQQRGDCLGIEGRQGLQTPNLDSLAVSGVRFTRAYSACPSCIAARRSVMSGQAPATHGMVGYKAHEEWRTQHTLPGELKRTGYQTVLVGRDMHLHPDRKRYGFDQMITTNHDYLHWLEEHTSSWQGGSFGNGIGPNDWTAAPWHLDEYLHATNWTVENGLRFLDDRDPSCPFFLTVSFTAPHPPLAPPAHYLERYLRMDIGEPVIGDWATPPPNDGVGQETYAPRVKLTGEALRYCYAGYYGLITHVDDQLSRFLLRIRQCAPNTYILFVADHGEMLGDHYLFRKRLPYAGSARVPCFLSGLDIEAGQVCDCPISHYDIMPTFLDLAKIPVPETVEGSSLVPLIGGGDAHWRTYVHGEHTLGGSYGGPEEAGMHFLTDGKEKYIWFVTSGREQLFNLVTDPTECHDLAQSSEYADKTNVWRKRLVAELANRPEGFTSGEKLIPGRPYVAALPHVHGSDQTS